MEKNIIQNGVQVRKFIVNKRFVNAIYSKELKEIHKLKGVAL